MRVENYGYAPVAGPVFLPLSLVGFIIVGAAAYNLVKRYRASRSHEERNRLLYLLLAMLFPMSGGLLDSFTNLPPVGIWTNLTFCIICSVAILKYHLLDIRIVVRKSLVYILISVVIAIPYVGILSLLHRILEPTSEPWWVHALIILFLAIVLRPLYSWAQQLVDRLFYRERYDYLRALQQFSRQAQTIVNLDELGSSLVHLVSGALRASSACLLLPSEDNSGLVLISSTGLESPPSRVVLRERSPLVEWLDLHGDILSSEQFDVIPQLQSFSLREKNNLKRMRAELYVPIKTHQGQLSGILVLGQKLSQLPYSNEDRDLLITLSRQMAINLENARLYNMAQQELTERKKAEEKERQLQQELNLSSRLASVGELAAGVAHEINNPLTGIMGFSQRLLRKSTDETSKRDLKRIYEEAQRAAKVIQNLRAFARRSEPKKEHSNIHDILQKALEMRIYELRTSNIEIITELASNLPPAMVDFQQIQQVFLNIIMNAEQTMTEANCGGKLVIKTQEHKGYIMITFTDDGPGISGKNLDKVFDPFFTSRGERGGTGLGLSICHGIVTDHGGKIYARSELGKGTTFFVELPVTIE